MGMKVSIERIFSEYNMNTALKIVTKKNPMPGLDGLRASELEEYWSMNKNAILKEIEKGTYNPTPLFIFFKIKPGKKEKRQISVCSVLDQMLLHCIRIELEKSYIPYFHKNSYGFIKGRGTQEALIQCCCFMNNGFNYVVDADIRKCFDSIKHRIVIEKIGRISKNNVTELISKYIKNPGMIGESIRYHRVGVPQGLCLSPLLTNIVLNSLDWFLYRKRMRFVRYADDLVVFCKNRQDAYEALNIIREYLEKELSLHLNNDKTSIIPAEELHYLGHAFVKFGNKYILAIDENIKGKMILKLQRQLKRKDDGKVEMLDRIGAFNRGWINYYRKAYPKSMIEFLQIVQESEIEEINNKLIPESSGKTETANIILESKGFVLPIDWYEEVCERSGII
ncbi:MAG: hypothetical protein IKS56_03780 [Lachnospiraceae bacterium]|nr:hypothetical protein [Lachnospiraceae bacterium]